MMHFTDIELRRWRDEGAGAESDRVIAHVAECPACASRYADAIRSMSLTADDAQDVDDFVAVGRALGPDTPSLRRWNRTAAFGALAAAAAIAIAIVVPRFREGPPPITQTLRGTGLTAVSPSSTVADRELQFVWASGVSAPRYRIEIGDPTATIYSGEAQLSPWTMPADVRARLQRGIAYWWTVTSLDANGSAVTTSARQAFVLTAP